MSLVTIIDTSTSELNSSASESVSPSSTTGSPIHTCTECGRTLSSRHNLQRHVANHCKKNQENSKRQATDEILNRACARFKKSMGTVDMKALLKTPPKNQQPEALPVTTPELEQEKLNLRTESLEQETSSLLNFSTGFTSSSSLLEQMLAQESERRSSQDSGSQVSEDVSESWIRESEGRAASEVSPSVEVLGDHYVPSWLRNNSEASDSSSTKAMLLEASDEVLMDSDEEEMASEKMPSFFTAQRLKPQRSLHEFITSVYELSETDDSLAPRSDPVKPVQPTILEPRLTAQMYKKIFVFPSSCLSCKLCEMIHETQEELNSHMVVEHGYVRCRLFRKGMCNSVLVTKSGECAHFRTVHKAIWKQTSRAASSPAHSTLKPSFTPRTPTALRNGSVISRTSEPWPGKPKPSPSNPVQRYLRDHGFVGFSALEENAGCDGPSQKRGNAESREGQTKLAALMEQQPWMK